MEGNKCFKKKGSIFPNLISVTSDTVEGKGKGGFVS